LGYALAPMRIPLLLVLAFGCAASIPPRYVVEKDIDDFGYRRYQHVLDVEFQVAENPAEGHTATYFRRGDRVVLATAFVTVYEKARGLAEELREQMEDLATYDATVQKREGEWVWVLEGDAPWVVWVSANRVVKLGGPGGGAVPEAILEEYLSIYPSDLEENGSADEDAESAGPSRAIEEESEELEVPASLQEGAPRE
jgi:hypothetical protein